MQNCCMLCFTELIKAYRIAYRVVFHSVIRYKLFAAYSVFLTYQQKIFTFHYFNSFLYKLQLKYNRDFSSLLQYCSKHLAGQTHTYGTSNGLRHIAWKYSFGILFAHCKSQQSLLPHPMLFYLILPYYIAPHLFFWCLCYQLQQFFWQHCSFCVVVLIFGFLMRFFKKSLQTLQSLHKI